jgi:metallo-beta-lactamase family protein
MYRRHGEIMDDEAREILRRDDDLFEFPGLTYIQSPKESAALNFRKGPFVVISASGMCENGRVRHHLKHAVSEPQNTIVIIGFQAQHTLGRRIVEKQPKLKIFDRILPLKAKVRTINGLSAHADAADFKWWFEAMASKTGIGQAFLVHGEPPAAQALAASMRDYCDENPVIPALYESFDV